MEHERRWVSALNPDSVVESYLRSEGQPFRSEDNRLVALSGWSWPVHGVAVSKRGR